MYAGASYSSVRALAPAKMRPMADEKLPTSRISRMAKIGRATANVAVKQAGTKAANVVRSPESSDKALERRQIETAEQIVTVLGGMKGAAMKVGQVLSFVDLGLVPEEYQEEFQAKLAALRDSAPTVSFEQMSKVIEQELGQPPSEAFAELDPAPVAAASIGQVYRGRLHDGRDVAIKVQYPGVNDAVRADMQNLGMLMRLAKRITPQMDVKAVTDEIRARIIEELDYELEASNHRTLARLYRGHPFIFIPPVVTEMCRERVIVTEFVEGDRFEQLTSGTAGRARPDRRDRLPLLLRLDVPPPPLLGRPPPREHDPHGRREGRLHRLRPLQGDRPARDGGRARDRSRRVRARTPRSSIACGPRRASSPSPTRSARTSSWRTRSTRSGGTRRTRKRRSPARHVQRIAIQAGDPRSTHFRTMRHQDMNPEHLIGRRLELLVLAVLGELQASANWHRIAREWMYGDAPVTELGKQEAEFLSRRG